MAAAALDCGARDAPNDKAHVGRSLDDDAESGFGNLPAAVDLSLRSVGAIHHCFSMFSLTCFRDQRPPEQSVVR
jgi:hypothetical protein